VSYARKKITLKVGVANVSIDLYVAVAGGGLMLITETILLKIPFASFANLRMQKMARHVLEYLSIEGESQPGVLAKMNLPWSESKFSDTDDLNGEELVNAEASVSWQAGLLRL